MLKSKSGSTCELPVPSRCVILKEVRNVYRGASMRYLMMILLPLTIIGCSSDGNKSTCVQGATQECLRGDGSAGFQECLGSGAWGECQAFSSGDARSSDIVGREDDLVSVDVGATEGLVGEDAVVADDVVDPPVDMVEGEDTLTPEDGGCVPDCLEKECGEDGCGGLCNGCLEFVFDDGDTDTAFGYNQAPDPAPSRIACMVRFELPQTGMRLTEFAAGWMYGLYNLQIPFELAWVAGEDVDCEEGPHDAWYKEWCSTKADKFTSIGDFLPLEPYEAMGAELLGEVVFTSSTVFVAALFDIDEYPIFVCPIDTSGHGKDSFMMPQVGDGMAGASFDKAEENVGVVPFRIKVEQSQ
jgi:hypothetical protein